jgi:type VI secretion system Hcp family effector
VVREVLGLRRIAWPGKAALLLAVGAAGGGAALAVASTGGGGAIEACVQVTSTKGPTGPLTVPNPSGPNLRIIDTSAGQSCNTAQGNVAMPYEQGLNWNGTGATGATGPSGPTGAEGAAGIADVITISGLTPSATAPPIGGMKLFGPGGHTTHFKFLSLELDQGSSAAQSPGAATGKRQHQPIRIVREVDRASPLLFQAVATAERFKTATVICRKAGSSHDDYLVITLTNVLVSSDQASSGGGNHELEAISFTYQSITIKPVTSNTPPDDWLGF